MRTIAVDDSGVCQPVCLARGFAVQKQLNLTREDQETLYWMGLPIFPRI